MTRSQLARLALCVGVAGAAVPILGVGAAQACSCTPRTDAELLRDANAVFTGMLVRTDDGPTPTPVGAGRPSGHPVTYTFAIDRVYKGRVTDPQPVNSGSDEASCGPPVRGDGPYVVFANRVTASKPKDANPSLSVIPLSSGLCNGTRELAAGEKLPFGRGRAPAAAPAVAPTAEPTPEIPDTLGPSTDDEDDDGFGGGAAAGIGVAAAALIACGVVLRRYGRN